MQQVANLSAFYIVVLLVSILGGGPRGMGN